MSSDGETVMWQSSDDESVFEVSVPGSVEHRLRMALEMLVDKLWAAVWEFAAQVKELGLGPEPIIVSVSPDFSACAPCAFFSVNPLFFLSYPLYSILIFWSFPFTVPLFMLVLQ